MRRCGCCDVDLVQFASVCRVANSSCSEVTHSFRVVSACPSDKILLQNRFRRSRDSVGCF